MKSFFNYYTGTLTEVEIQLQREAEDILRQRIIDICSDLGADPDWIGSEGHLDTVLLKLRGIPNPSDDIIAKAIRDVDGVDKCESM